MIHLLFALMLLQQSQPIAQDSPNSPALHAAEVQRQRDAVTARHPHPVLPAARRCGRKLWLGHCEVRKGKVLRGR